MAKSHCTTGYANPPLVEVFCEFYFESSEDGEWDAFLVPQLYEKVKAKFPQKKRLATVGIEFKMPRGPHGIEVKQQGPPTPRHQFLSEDGKSSLQIGENLLVVNQLPPYYGWAKFEPNIVDAFKKYAALWKPKKVERLALHYVDKIGSSD